MVSPINSALSTLQYWTQSNVPAVYDDSLSYYELVSKVIAQLNSNTDFSNGLKDSFNQLLANTWIETKNLKDGIVTLPKLDPNITKQPTTEIGQQAKFQEIDSSLLAIATLVSGLDPTGSADNTTIIQTAVNLVPNGGKLLLPNGTFKISNNIDVPDNVSVEGAGNGTVILLANGDISGFYINGRSGSSVRNLKIKSTVVGTTSYTAGVKLNNSTKCIVENVTFEGFSWAGVYLSDSSENKILNNRFSGWMGTLQDAADICIHRNSNFNLIQGNHCFGGGDHGILIQDPYANTIPSKNMVDNNIVGQHNAYGIAAYHPYAGDSYNRITNNYIENIKGTSVNGNTGCGIYVQGYGAGGASIIGNTTKNCNTGSSGRTNAPGAIGVAGLSSTNAPVVIANNNVCDVKRYDGILSVSNEGAPIAIIGNTVSMPAGNTNGDPIRVENSQNTSVIGNMVKRASDIGRGILVFANGLLNQNIKLNDNEVIGGADHQIDFVNGGAGTFKNVTVNGNHITGGSSNAIPLYMLKVDTATVNGNTCDAGSSYAGFFNNCTKTRVGGNTFTSTGLVSVGMSGTCSDSYFDKSNGINANIENTSTGFHCEQLLNKRPDSPSSFAIVGDRAEHPTPAVGDSKSWRCTAAGNPGTWVSEGSL